MTTVNDNSNEISRKATNIIRPDYYQHRVAVDNFAKTSFDELKTVTRAVQIELKSAVDTVSNLTNNIETTDGGVEVATTGEYRVFTNDVTSAFSSLQSGGRGRYIPGYEAECGVGLRLPADQTYAGTQKIEWGYFDDDDGIGYGIDANGFYVFVERFGVVTTKTYQADFNQDTLSGDNTNANPSGFTFDRSTGNIFQMEFVWYGYGPIQWFINLADENDPRGSRLVLMHQISPDQATSISQPNLPISVRVDNGNQATGLEVFVGGRQFSVYGVLNERARINGNYRLSQAVSSGVWTPLISFRRKAGRGDNQTVRVQNVEIITNQDLIYSFVSGGTLTGATFGALRDISPNETVVESDRAATAITGGTFFGGYAFATSSKPNASETTRLSNIKFEFVNSSPVTLVVKPFSSNATVSSVMDVEESW